MTKYKMKKYLTIIPFIVSFLIGCCIYDYWEFFNFLDTYPSVRLSDKAIFLNIAGGRNYLSEVNISVYYVIALYSSSVAFKFAIFKLSIPTCSVFAIYISTDKTKQFCEAEIKKFIHNRTYS